MEFLTNFTGDKEHFYRRASEIHNLKYEIRNEAYSSAGTLLDFDDYKAFYVDSSVKDLSDFWRTFERLKNK